MGGVPFTRPLLTAPPLLAHLPYPRPLLTPSKHGLRCARPASKQTRTASHTAVFYL